MLRLCNSTSFQSDKFNEKSQVSFRLIHLHSLSFFHRYEFYQQGLKSENVTN